MRTRGEIIGMDLGTRAFRVCTSEGLEHEESGAVLCVAENGKLRGIGEKTAGGIKPNRENLRLLWPMGGAFSTREKILAPLVAHLIEAVQKPGTVFRPRLQFSVRDSWSGLEQKALIRAAVNAGARDAQVIPASHLAARAAGKEQAAVFACLDIGASRSDMVVLRQGRVIQAQSFDFSGKELDGRIVKGLAEEHQLWISETAAERLKEEKCAKGEASAQLLILNGRNVSDATPMRLSIESGILWHWLYPAIDELAEQLVRFLGRLSPGDRTALAQNGLWLVGGTAALSGLATRLEKGVGLPIHVLSQPEAYALQAFRKIFSEDENL